MTKRERLWPLRSPTLISTTSPVVLEHLDWEVSMSLPHWRANSVNEEDHSSLDRRFRGTLQSTRKECLSIVRVSRTIEEAGREISDLWQRRVKRVVTGASDHPRSIAFGTLRRFLEDRDTPFLILFGTGWGLTQEVKDSSDYVLARLKEWVTITSRFVQQ